MDAMLKNNYPWLKLGDVDLVSLYIFVYTACSFLFFLDYSHLDKLLM